MKGYYLFAPIMQGCLGAESGVERKVRSQCKALQKSVPCELVIFPEIHYKHTILEKIMRRLPGTAAWRIWKYHGEFDDADYLYIRQVQHDDSFVRYLRSIRKSNPDIKIVYEIPTYPYGLDNRWTFSTFMLELKEHICRQRAAKFFDRIVTFYGQEEIWNVSCLKLLNGYDFSTVHLPVRKKTEKKCLISVATSAKWHGYDRVVEGIHRYYEQGGKENIEYHMVGAVLPEIQQLVDHYQLHDHVILHGKMFGKELEDVYRQCFMGFDVLAGHRIGSYSISSTLKSREYGAYGLPIITASRVDYMEQDCPYQMIVPDDESPIDFKEVIQYYDKMFDGKNCNQIAAEIREYAAARCDMQVTMKPVAEWLLGELK